uniref:Uncharacterized protein n=1 Tax=Chromera velia CCMP2878 TaxID=1169474 RepID=A0A0G4GWS3_9ALVE|eukprot:Cvel_23703.t1-p1 / transcript=Cvel_23703.t1 / gene=Cvel_23703 / organism=Chromera_velia_CCMP2878 / gene_product=hypothetical protein / transcript_product=hypothetical protein / location=Cvel_scaffold2474:17176-18813(+) / protein_length=546 / sequence_SO=supercontig / SO=protein_coding / is_pseudo=false
MAKASSAVNPSDRHKSLWASVLESLAKAVDAAAVLDVLLFAYKLCSPARFACEKKLARKGEERLVWSLESQRVFVEQVLAAREACTLGLLKDPEACSVTASLIMVLASAHAHEQFTPVFAAHFDVWLHDMVVVTLHFKELAKEARFVAGILYKYAPMVIVPSHALGPAIPAVSHAAAHLFIHSKAFIWSLTRASAVAGGTAVTGLQVVAALPALLAAYEIERLSSDSAEGRAARLGALVGGTAGAAAVGTLATVSKVGAGPGLGLASAGGGGSASAGVAVTAAVAIGVPLVGVVAGAAGMCGAVRAGRWAFGYKQCGKGGSGPKHASFYQLAQWHDLGEWEKDKEKRKTGSEVDSGEEEKGGEEEGEEEEEEIVILDSVWEVDNLLHMLSPELRQAVKEKAELTLEALGVEDPEETGSHDQAAATATDGGNAKKYFAHPGTLELQSLSVPPQRSENLSMSEGVGASLLSSSNAGDSVVAQSGDRGARLVGGNWGSDEDYEHVCVEQTENCGVVEFSGASLCTAPTQKGGVNAGVVTQAATLKKAVA